MNRFGLLLFRGNYRAEAVLAVGRLSLLELLPQYLLEMVGTEAEVVEAETEARLHTTPLEGMVVLAVAAADLLMPHTLVAMAAL